MKSFIYLMSYCMNVIILCPQQTLCSIYSPSSFLIGIWHSEILYHDLNVSHLTTVCKVIPLLHYPDTAYTQITKCICDRVY